MTPKQFSRTVLEAAREICAFEDAEAVAAFLGGEGIKGVRFDPCNCPVAVFITKRIGPYPGSLLNVTVGASSVNALDFSSGMEDGTGDPKLRAYVGFTQSVQDFIRYFDNNGRWPELEASDR